MAARGCNMLGDAVLWQGHSRFHLMPLESLVCPVQTSSSACTAFKPLFVLYVSRHTIVYWLSPIFLDFSSIGCEGLATLPS